MNWLERDAASVWHPLTQYSRCLDDERTVITRVAEGSWLYDVDGNRVLDGASSRAVLDRASSRAVTVVGGTSAPDATKEPGLPPPDPDLPSGPSPTDPEGPTDPKPDEPTDPTGPDEPPAIGRARLAVDGAAG
ncbi:MAG: adenosylmethionine-8-amino-7-oxononanoateamino transferase [Dactylosporangium sp.]|jgi:hypothetical protein|nr:adenosylmethionine-8-amino-7-oxononanoateamino transferase [Dactylosporangium sp.]